jgi:hypothetical protein
LPDSQKTKFFVLLFFIIGAFIGRGYLQYETSNEIELTIDALISDGVDFKIAINERWGSPQAERTVPGMRHLYTFKKIPGIVRVVRLEPTKKTGVKIIIYSLEFRQNSKSLKKIPLNNLLSWRSGDLKIINSNSGDYLEMESTSEEPFLQNDNLQISFNGIALNKIAAYIEKFSLFTFPSILGIIFVLVAWRYIILLKKKNSWMTSYYLTCILVASVLLSKLLYSAAILTYNKISQVYDTVGFASYTGYVSDVGFRAFWVIILGCGIFTYCVLRGLQKIKKQKINEEIPLDKNIKMRKYYPWFPIILIISYVILNFPYIYYLSTHTPEIINISDFDTSNSVIWQYFRYLHLIPFRDFWYIYAGFYYTLSQSPPDIFFRLIHTSLLFGVISFSLYRIFKFSKKKSLICILFFWLIQALVPSTQRYFLSVSVILLFAASILAVRRSTFLFLGCYIFYIFFMEPTQLVYAIPTFGILLTSGLLLNKQKNEKINFIKKLAFTFYGSFPLIIFYLFYLWTHNALNEYLGLYSGLGAMANYSMKPFGILNSAYHVFSWLGVYWWIVFIFFLIALLRLANKSKKNIVFEDFIPISLAILSIVVFQKSLIRPMMDGFEIAIFGIFFFFCQSDFRKLQKSKIALAGSMIFIGFFLLIFFTKNSIAHTVLKNYSQRILTIHKDISVLFLNQKKWMEIQKKYFSLKRFIIDGVYGDEFKKNLLKKIQLKKNDDIFVLGDDSYLYIILEQQAPFYVTFYNQSILYSQKNTIDWINVHNPKYVLWRNTFKDFDDVPNYTRVPLVFERVIQDYKFKNTYGSFVILERKKSEEPVDFNFWREYLGNTILLGFIPGRSEPNKFEIKEMNGQKNTYESHFLTINISNPIPERREEISFNVNGNIYKIAFQEEKKVFSYNINLERVWFWKIAHTTGIEPKIINKSDAISYIQIRNITTSRDILY